MPIGDKRSEVQSREAIARLVNPGAFVTPRHPAPDDHFWRCQMQNSAYDIADQILALNAAQAVLAPSDCDWPDEPFTFRDEPGKHDPCYVVMPGGAMLPLNHHAEPGVDIARAKFIVDACNMALSPDFPHVAVAEAMQDAWNTICTDTGCHPLDIERRGKELFFKPGHWADLVALFLSRSPSIPSAQSGSAAR